MIKQIKIGSTYYSIELVDRLESKDTVALDGNLRFDESEIKLRASLSPQRLVQTLFHEIIHGIFDQVARDADDQTIDALAHGIMQVLRDNPALFDEIKSLDRLEG